MEEVTGFRPIAFIYLRAKHMVTGYDHFLFLAGVVYLLHRSKDKALYVSIFANGQSVTMIAGVCWQVTIDAYIIAFSLVYKALDNMGAFRRRRRAKHQLQTGQRRAGAGGRAGRGLHRQPRLVLAQ